MIRVIIVLLLVGCSAMFSSAKKTDTQSSIVAATKAKAEKKADTVTVVEQKPTLIEDYDGPNLRRKTYIGAKRSTTRKIEDWERNSSGVVGSETQGHTEVHISWSMRVLAWFAQWWPWLLVVFLLVSIFVAIRMKLYKLIPVIGPLLPDWPAKTQPK